MATFQMGMASGLTLRSYEGLRPGLSVSGRTACAPVKRVLTVRAATALAPKFSKVKPLGDRVLVKTEEVAEKTQGGILLPSEAQNKPQGGEVVAVGDGKAAGKEKLQLSVEPGAKVVYSMYAGTEIDFHGVNHLLVKEDDIVGILETDDIKDLKPLYDQILIKVQEAEQETAGGLLLTPSAEEKPSIGTVVAVGPGAYDEEGKRKPMPLAPGKTVLYSKFAGNDFKSADGSEYVTLRVSDALAVLS